MKTKVVNGWGSPDCTESEIADTIAEDVIANVLYSDETDYIMHHRPDYRTQQYTVIVSVIKEKSDERKKCYVGHLPLGKPRGLS